VEFGHREYQIKPPWDRQREGFGVRFLPSYLCQGNDNGDGDVCGVSWEEEQRGQGHMRKQKTRCRLWLWLCYQYDVYWYVERDTIKKKK